MKNTTTSADTKKTENTEKYLDQAESIRKVQSQESEALEQQLKALARDYNTGTIEAVRDLILARINSTLSENPIRVALFGVTSGGKTSIINCLTGGNFQISQGTRDTTQDIMVHEFGAVGVCPDGKQIIQNFKLIDTPGFGEILQTAGNYFNRLLNHEVGERVDYTRNRNFDIAICVLECLKWDEFDDLHKRIIEAGVPVLLVSNKYDKIMAAKMGEMSAKEHWEKTLDSKIPSNVKKCYFIGLGDDDLDSLPRKLDLDVVRKVKDTLTTEFKQGLLGILNDVRACQYQNICKRYIKLFLDERMTFIKKRWKDVDWMQMTSADYEKLASQSSSQHFGLSPERNLDIESDVASVQKVLGGIAVGGGGIAAYSSEIIRRCRGCFKATPINLSSIKVQGAAVSIGIVASVVAAGAYFGVGSLKHLYNLYKDTGIEEIERNREEAEIILMEALACGVPVVLNKFCQSNHRLGLQSSQVKLKMQQAPRSQQPAPRPADGRTFP